MKNSEAPFQIKYYKDSRGRSPFLDWLEKLGDRIGRVKIKVRIDRLERGHFGDCRSVGIGVHELRMHFGPGYRIYFGILERHIVVILCGGTKQTQERDLQKAKQYWTSLQEGAL